MLRLSLTLDAVVTAATGLLLALGAPLLAALLGMPEPLLRWAGVSLLPFALLVLLLARSARAPRAAVWAVVLYNGLWALDSVLLLALGWVSPTALGSAFVLFQAVVVAGFALAQYAGLQRSPALG
ncbi:hypothetical protein FGE12_07905 [Aggregicoccus sp. 17bor-14]|uniref:hypothetical protein n=1 Tax=Myxococcaceae TaxID=31 RepID=UPI00129CC8EB|nr:MULTISPECIES: hypothetical protein [Myxococcaceae]MBF5042320.1 hypothetical protein [Simulacricoccus sp. 17bor-14]MRI88094.1 hypothetical protein [Aggregicoccus sp. 17bor-14]